MDKVRRYRIPIVRDPEAFRCSAWQGAIQDAARAWVQRGFQAEGQALCGFQAWAQDAILSWASVPDAMAQSEQREFRA